MSSAIFLLVYVKFLRLKPLFSSFSIVLLNAANKATGWLMFIWLSYIILMWTIVIMRYLERLPKPHRRPGSFLVALWIPLPVDVISGLTQSLIQSRSVYTTQTNDERYFHHLYATQSQPLNELITPEPATYTSLLKRSSWRFRKLNKCYRILLNKYFSRLKIM